MQGRTVCRRAHAPWPLDASDGSVARSGGDAISGVTGSATGTSEISESDRPGLLALSVSPNSTVVDFMSGSGG